MILFGDFQKLAARRLLENLRDALRGRFFPTAFDPRARANRLIAVGARRFGSLLLEVFFVLVDVGDLFVVAIGKAVVIRITVAVV